MKEFQGKGYILKIITTIEPDAEWADILVNFDDGRRYSATLVTLKNIENIMNQYQQTEENNFGQYYWEIDSLIMRQITEEEVVSMVQYIVENNEIDNAMMRLSDSGYEDED
jgi:hypothetical protein